jgi:hypothetical protein
VNSSPSVLASREVGLRIHVDEEHLVALLGQRSGEVDRGRRLADATLLVRDRDDVRQGLTSERAGGARAVVTVGEWGNATPRVARANAEVVHTLPYLCTVLWTTTVDGDVAI